MNKLYVKLASINIKNNRQFYLPYLLTGIISVAMFYLVVSMQKNPGLKEMPGGSDIGMILGFGVSIVGFFVSIFLFYTNSFIIKRRKKELGVYNILGMEKKHIAKVLFLETLFTAVVTIAGGLIFGIVFNKLLSMFLYHLTRLEVSIPFYISKEGCAVTLALFGIIYAAALIYNFLQIKLANPIELLHGTNTGEREPKTKILLTLIGIVCTGGGYVIAITTTNAVEALMLFFVAVILVIIGTYCLFTAGSIALLKILRKNKKYYYQTKHFTTVSGMIYRMKQNAVGLANICILSTMVLVTLSTTVSMYLGIEDEMDARYPAEISAVAYYEGMPEQTDDITEVIKNSLKSSGRVITAQAGYINMSLSAIRKENHFQTVAFGASTEYNVSDVSLIEIIPKEDYETLTGESVIELKEGEVAIASDTKLEGNTVSFNGREYPVVKNYEFPEAGEDYYAVVGGYFYMIVKDRAALGQIYQELKETQSVNEVQQDIRYSMQFDIDGTTEEKLAAEEVMRQAVAGWWEAEESGQMMKPFNIYIETRAESYSSFYVLYGGMFFLGLFLGTMFLMVTVLIIFYKQISEGYEDKERYAIMEKVGMSNDEVKRAIRSQILTVFFLPIAVAAIHVIAAFPMIRRMLSMLNLMNVTLFFWCLVGTVLVFGVIYMIVFLLTSRSYYKIVGNQV